MKTGMLSLALLLSFSAWGQDASLVWPMFKVRSGVKQVRGQDAFSVQVSVEKKPMQLSQNVRRISVDGATYRRARALSETILRVESGHDVGTDRDTVSFGTAFHVGGNYIITNRHVLSPRQTNWTRCNGLRVTSTAGHSYDCFQVVYCEPTPVCGSKNIDSPIAEFNKGFASSSCTRTQDLCLIEIKTQKRHPFANIPSLPLRSGKPEASTTAAYSTVGNSNNFGLHFSESRGLRWLSDWRMGVKTQAFPGNSGGPLINEQDEAVGLLFARNGSTETFAVSMEWILGRLKERLGEDHPAWQALLPNIR